MWKRKLLLIIPVLLYIFSSCSDQKNGKRFIIGFSQCTGADSWRQTMLDEMKRELSFHNNNVDFLYRDAGASSQKQIEQIRELVKRHIDLLIVSPNEAKPLSPVIEQVYNSGIPVVVVDRHTNTDKFTAIIGVSNFEVGQSAGRYAVAILKGKGNILEVSGLPGASPFIDRHRGFMDIIGQYPDLHYIKKIDFDSLSQVEETTLRDNPNIDLIYAQNDFMAYDTWKICKKLGIEQRVKIIGTDGLPGKGLGLDMVANKNLVATVLYPTGGQEAILTAVNILENKPYLKENNLATTMIDSSNVRIMKLQSDKANTQQKDIEERQKIINRQIIITQNQYILLLVITLAFLVTIVLAGISYYYLRENKKITSRLARQNIEISVQKNQLVEMSAKAEEAHQAKLNFFTNISHEFRTPLTLILSPLEDLIQHPKLQPQLKQTLYLVQKNVLRLYRLVNQLMDFRKIEFGKMKPHASQNDLVGFLQEIVSSYDVLVKQKQINLTFSTTERIMEVWFDVTMIDKVIFNLLSNAFKFTGENGFIHLSLSSNNESAMIRIEDNGIGMAPELVPHVFEPFFQGEYENYKGTGLGLALSKELIDLHHGSITVKSEKLKGTSFEIRLPLGNAHFSPDEIVTGEARENPVKEDTVIYTTELYERLPAAEEGGEKQGHKTNSILVIEDNNDLRKYMVGHLAKTHDVMEADSAHAGLQLIFDNIPDLIICDVVIPGKTGLEITRIVKADIRTAHIPVILLTARSNEQQKVEGLKSGADAYITKPFNFPYLLETIHTLLENREKTRNFYSGEVLAETKSQVSKKTDRKFISEFAAIVEQNIGNDAFSVDLVCKQLNISRMQLYRKVKTLLDCNVNDYIINTRLQKARYYLQHEELSIAEIAFKTGFSSATYFSTTFKAKFGLTPTEFKEKGKSMKQT